MESIRGADYCVLAAEPTVFGAQNLAMVYELVTLFKKPSGVILNKCQGEDNPSERFCLDKGINILAEIPFDCNLGALCSNADIAVRKDEKYRVLFAGLLETILKEAVR
jgi:MinD superfamily P-loop ATPase